MIIYARRRRAVASYNTTTRDLHLDAENVFFSANKGEIFVTYNGEEDKRKYNNLVIYSAVFEGDILSYCAAAGLNCCIDDTDAARATYDLTILLANYETLIQPRFDLFVMLIKNYKLSPLCFRMSNTQLLKEVLRWS